MPARDRRRTSDNGSALRAGHAGVAYNLRADETIADSARRHAVNSYEIKTAQLLARWRPGTGRLRLGKRTISNLFRYQPSRRGRDERLELDRFDEIIAIDPARRTLDVEGLATYETIVDATLAEGLLPLVSPELKHITVGGASVGIGIESTGFRHGFVHDGLLDADVLLPDGRIVTCRPDDEYADLFHALPNSYGTLGYILRARLRLQPAKPYVDLRVERFDELPAYLDAMRRATEHAGVDFVEGLLFEDRRFLLMTGTFADAVPGLDDLLRRDVFYKLVQSREHVHLRTRDYIFRYDPDWFWNVPDAGPYQLFRRFAPARWRSSAFYTRYAAARAQLRPILPWGASSRTEPLIQDWEVPWNRAAELVEFCLGLVRLGGGRPWAAVPIRTPRTPTLYPIRAKTLYFNLGCYCQVSRPTGAEPFHYTRRIDERCFELGGIKMLYSSTFLTPEEFERRYAGSAYRELKRKYDPSGRTPTLFEKATMGSR